jgi:hypothetical protein
MKSLLAAVALSVLLFACDNKKKERSSTSKENINPSYDIENVNLSIHTPDNWKLEADSANFLIFKEKCPKDKLFCTNLVIRSIDNTNALTIDEIAELYIKGLEGRFKEVKIVSVANKEIDGITSKVIDYKILENDTHLGNTAVFIVRLGKVVSFNFTAENNPEGSYVNQRKLFFEMLSSVKF